MFISQIKYTNEMLKKFNMQDCKLVGTPMITGCKLSKEDDSPIVDQKLYRSMIGSLLFTTTRPDVMHVVCQVEIFQTTPKETHLLTVKIFFRYLKGTFEFGLWYPKGNNLNLFSFTDAD